jgi:hypothetical protein
VHNPDYTFPSAATYDEGTELPSLEELIQLVLDGAADFRCEDRDEFSART